MTNLDSNKIFINSPININRSNMSIINFIDGKCAPKKTYSLVNNTINIHTSSTEFINLFYNQGVAKTYEFFVPLKESSTILSKEDLYFTEITNLIQDNILVFINGLLLLPDEYTVIDSSSISIDVTLPNNDFNDINIYASNSKLTRNIIKNIDDENIINIAYNKDNTLIFKNRVLINPDIITVLDKNNIKLNTIITELDTIEVITLNPSTQSLYFHTDLGYITYGPYDLNGKKVPELFDATITFNNQVKLCIDNVRTGFIIKEVDGDGEAIILDNNFETFTVKCIIINQFKNITYLENEYYVEVPEVKSIINYLANYDKKFKLLPEILTVFQKVVLNELEAYIEKIRDFRNINRIDSENINKLIGLLGFNLNIKTLTLKQRHEILEELAEFYRRVGTRDSYNMFNLLQNDIKLINMEQLFTPHTPQEKSINKIYDYTYNLNAGGNNYKKDSINQIKNTDLSIKVTEIGKDGAITQFIPLNNTSEGYTEYNGIYDIVPPISNIQINVDSIPNLFDYKWSITDSIGYKVNQKISTSDNKYQITITKVSENGRILGFTVPVSQGSEPIEIQNEPLYLNTADNLQLNVQSISERNLEETPEILLYSKDIPGKFEYIIPDGVTITKIEIAGATGGFAWDLENNLPLNNIPGKGVIKTYTDIFENLPSKTISGTIGACPIKNKEQEIIGGSGFTNGENGSKIINSKKQGGGGGGSTGFIYNNITYEASAGSGAPDGISNYGGKGGGNEGGPRASATSSKGNNATGSSKLNENENGWVKIYGIEKTRLLVYSNTTGGAEYSTILQPGVYEIEISGGGGSGGAVDSTGGDEADGDARSGFAGELITNKTFTLLNPSKIYGVIGQGGGKVRARGHDYGPQWTREGKGYENGKKGEGGAYSFFGTTFVYCEGTGGGSTNLFIENSSVKFIAKGGNGGAASRLFGIIIDMFGTVYGGIGGSGGTISGTGAAGGARNSGASNFWSEDGKDGWVKIWKLKQKYLPTVTGDFSLIENNETFKTTDNNQSFTITAKKNGNDFTFKINPEYGDLYINKNYGLKSTKENTSARLTVTSIINNYKYILSTFGDTTNLQAGNILDNITTNKNEKFVYTISEIQNNTLIGTYTPKIGNNYIKITNQSTQLRGGSGGKISITSNLNDQKSEAREYIDFYSKEECGAVLKREYRVPKTNYGFVNEGTPNAPFFWQIGNPDIDYHRVNDTTTEYLDYGKVTDKIQGEWVEWWEWDRNKIWYPTNHVEVEIKMPSGVNYEDYTKRFIEQFYNLASTVLYIHRLVESYYFGNDITDSSNVSNTSGAFLGILTGETINENIITLTSDPNRQVIK